MTETPASAASRAALIKLLADGRPHREETLSSALGLGTAALRERIGELAMLGIEPQRMSDDRYRLTTALQLLDRDAILRDLPAEVRARLTDLQVMQEIDSTNARLLAGSQPPPGKLAGCLAEFQHHGRGRRGRRWIGAYGSGLCLSLGWRFASPPRDYPALGLALGVGVLATLRKMGVRGVTLKWPNDLLADGRKLGGILVELQRAGQESLGIVAGIGLNWRLPAAARRSIEQGIAPTDLHDISSGQPPSRNRLAAALIAETMEVFQMFEREGLAAFRRALELADALRGRQVVVLVADQRFSGQAAGIDHDGAFLLREGEVERRFLAGEVSVREAR